MYKVVTRKEELQELIKGSEESLKALKNPRVYLKLETLIECLNYYYGVERDLEKDIGGYVVLVYGNREEIKRTSQNILAYHNLNDEDYEFKDVFKEPKCSTEVTFRLFLCSSDYSVEIVTFEKEEGAEEKNG